MMDDLAPLHSMLYSQPMRAPSDGSSELTGTPTETDTDIESQLQSSRLNPEDRRILIRKLLGNQRRHHSFMN